MSRIRTEYGVVEGVEGGGRGNDHRPPLGFESHNDIRSGETDADSQSEMTARRRDGTAPHSRKNVRATARMVSAGVRAVSSRKSGCQPDRRGEAMNMVF